MVLCTPVFVSSCTEMRPPSGNINHLTPNDPYMGRTAPLTSKRCFLYIYSTNIATGYFKHALYFPFFSLSSKCSLFHNANLFRSCIIHILYTECAKIKKKKSFRRQRVNREMWFFFLICVYGQSVCTASIQQHDFRAAESRFQWHQWYIAQILSNILNLIYDHL